MHVSPFFDLMLGLACFITFKGKKAAPAALAGPAMLPVAPAGPAVLPGAPATLPAVDEDLYPTRRKQ